MFLVSICPNVNENINNQRLKTIFHWPATQAGVEARLHCDCQRYPQFSNGLFAFKNCSNSGLWENTYLEPCVVSDIFRSLCSGVS